MSVNDEHGAHSANEPRREPAAVRVEPTARPVMHEQHEIRVPAPTSLDRRDLVRWGPIWAGLVTTLSAFLLLELIFLALGWLSLAQGEEGSTTGLVSGILGFVAFLVGGMVAGATAMWRSAKDGLLQGAIMWGLATLAIIFLTLFGGGALFGSAAEVLTQVASIQRANLPEVDFAAAMDTVNSTITWAVVGLVLSLLAAALGGAIGGKMWPGKKTFQADR